MQPFCVTKIVFEKTQKKNYCCLVNIFYSTGKAELHVGVQLLFCFFLTNRNTHKDDSDVLRKSYLILGKSEQR